MGVLVTKVSLKCLKLILEPIVSFCLRHSLTYQDAIKVLKELFVEQAAKEIIESGGKANVSRISVASGLRRKEVLRHQEKDQDDDRSSGMFTRVIDLWISNPLYSQEGAPRELTAFRKESDFSRLVESISTDISPGSILQELIRVGVVQKSGDRIRLLYEGFSPQNNPVDGFKLLSLDMDDFIRTVEENMYGQNPMPQHHITTEYTNIDVEQLPHIRTWLLEMGNDFHRKLRNYLRKFDSDSNPQLRKGGARVVLGSYARAYMKKKQN